MTVSPSRKRELQRVRNQKRKRAPAPRPKTAPNQMTVADLVQLRLANDSEEARHPPPPRPKTRADCIDGPRPCPWACRYSLLHEITASGGVQTVHPKDADGHEHSCVLDYVDDHVDGATSDEIAAELNVTRECVRTIEAKAIRKLKRYGAGLRECL